MAPASYQVGQGKPPRAQYHHFIPRFILRNYASSIQLPTGSAKRRQNRRSQSQAKDGTLNVIDLENVKVTQTPVSRTFGQLDMYRDFNGADQFDLEKRLSKLESQAGIILGKVRKAFEIGSPDIWLKRAERDTLRKFLFIMKYRSQCFYQRYNPETGAYEADDKELMLNYMKDKGITNPMDVWFRNLKAFIELDMDPEGEWIEKIQEQAYPGDARWFGAHIQGAYLAFCQTSRPDDEFLLTGNAYAIFEGANSETFDPATGIGTTVVYSEYHCFAPLSPTLMIVLRSNLLPDGRKEPDETDVLFQFTKSLHLDPASADSTLQDLPVKKCRNSYSRVEHGESILTEAYALPRSQHSFCFQFFRVTSQHVQTINNIMLAEASSMSTIVFKSIAATRNALEKYLTEYDPKYKIVLDSPNDKQAIFFSNLEAIVQQLGGSARSNHKIHYLQKNEEEFFDTMGQRIRDALPTTDTPFMRLYRKLGGVPETLPKDMDQARRMLNLVIKVDVAIKHLSPKAKAEVRYNRQELLISLPVQRVWLFLKNIRNIRRLSHPEVEGIEDVVARTSHIFRADALTRKMFLASRTQDFLATNPDHGLVKEFTLNAEGFRRVTEEKHLVFERIGSIRDCGKYKYPSIPALPFPSKHPLLLLLLLLLPIQVNPETKTHLTSSLSLSLSPPQTGINKIEDLARALHNDNQARQTRVHDHHNQKLVPQMRYTGLDLLSDEQRLELATRNGVRETFFEVLAGDVEKEEEKEALQDLKEVMFSTLYPVSFGGARGGGAR